MGPGRAIAIPLYPRGDGTEGDRGSVEVMGGPTLRVGRGGLETLAEGPEALGADRGDAVLVLERALHQEEGLARDGQAMAPEQGRSHDRVPEPGLILQGQEREALGGARALGADGDKAPPGRHAAGQPGSAGAATRGPPALSSPTGAAAGRRRARGAACPPSARP